MGYYILRRLLWSVLTVFGVMLLTFALFRVVAGEIASSWVGKKATVAQRAEWEHRHGYDQPTWVNLHNRLVLIDKTGGQEPFSAADGARTTQVLDALSLVIPTAEESGNLDLHSLAGTKPGQPVTALVGRYVYELNRETPLIGKDVPVVGATGLTGGMPLRPPPKEKPGNPPAAAADHGEDEPAAPVVAATQPAKTPPATAPAAAPTTGPAMQASASRPATMPHTTGAATGPASAPAEPPAELVLTLADRSVVRVSLEGVETAGELIDRINNHPGNGGKVLAAVSSWGLTRFFHSQFFHHLYTSATFDSVSLKDGRELTEIISDHVFYSLALMIPAMAIGWFLDLIIASLVAYYRGSMGDRVGVFMAVLGMCIPFLAFMMYGQSIMWAVSPEHAYGIFRRANIYLPVMILVIAYMGGSVRFYRTVILDETNRDYVRTARAKGLSLATILFKHVLKNCMLPILTSLVMAIPFLIMGNLLLERFFGIPGLGDLLLTSYNERNEPILNGLVFLSSLMYTVSVLITDISYAVFDPRIRLK